MKRLALVAALIMVAIFPGVAEAAVRQTTIGCADYDLQNSDPRPFVCMSEDGNMGGDKLILTAGTDDANLSDPAGSHTLPGTCGVVNIDDNWNDCISDVYVVLPPGWCVRGYEDKNYLGDRTFAISNTGSSTIIWNSPTLTGAANDATSSVIVRAC